MTNTYNDNVSDMTKIVEELRCIRCVLERLLVHMDRAGFVDYQMEKFSKHKE